MTNSQHISAEHCSPPQVSAHFMALKGTNNDKRRFLGVRRKTVLWQSDYIGSEQNFFKKTKINSYKARVTLYISIKSTKINLCVSLYKNRCNEKVSLFWELFFHNTRWYYINFSKIIKWHIVTVDMASSTFF